MKVDETQAIDEPKSYPIFTIGYGKRTVDDLISTLKQHQIAYLIDVRSVPFSRFSPGFNKDALEKTLATHSIRYVFMGEALGGRPKDETCYIDGKVDYARCSEAAWYKEGIARLKTAWQKRLRVAVMCSEGKPEDCHRSKLIGQTLAKEGVDVVHIDEHSQGKSQHEVISLLTAGQVNLFDVQFTSRKQYRRASRSDTGEAASLFKRNKTTKSRKIRLMHSI